MNRADLDFFKHWFYDYSKSFHSSDPEEQRNISLKERHTENVCGIITELAGTLSLDENRLLIAETSGLFHDVGRFQQYATYKTFRDSISVNHGRLGADILRERGILSCIPEHEQQIILGAIQYHNAYSIPPHEGPETVLFLKLVRDADKLDIWEIFLGFFEGNVNTRASEAGLGLPDLPGFSDNIVSSVLGMKIISLADLKCINDFILMQLSWLYDLNFNCSVALFSKRNYIDRLTALLPPADEIKRVREFLAEYSKKKMRELTAV